MPNIYNIDFTNLTQQLMPPILRKPVQKAWFTALTAPLQYNNQLFEEYAFGAVYPLYSGATVYTAGTRIIYTDRGVYENLTGSTGVAPTDVNTWFLCNENYLGSVERSKYKAQKYLYEYALNMWFEVPGISTNSYFGPSASTIYIRTNTAYTENFLMGNVGEYSDVMGNNSLFSYVYMGSDYLVPNQYDYTIMVPSGMSGTATVIEVTAFAEMVNLAGMLYSIEYY